jgi:hypothetical protein
MSMLIGQRVVLALASMAAFLLVDGRATADFMLVTSRAALGGTDLIDWGQLGPPTPPHAEVPNPSQVVSNGGVSFTITETSPGLNFARVDQGAGPGIGPWFGNFAPGDHLLYTGTFYGGGSGPISLSSNGPALYAMGAQIDTFLFGLVQATIVALDANGRIVGEVSANGINNGQADNSALFIGIRSTIPFTTVDFGAAGNNLAINQVSLSTSPAATVPEPASVILLALGAVGLGGGYFRRRKVRT